MLLIHGVLSVAVTAEETPGLVTFRGSTGITEVTGLNRHGTAIGRREVPITGGWSLDSFVRVGERIAPVKIPQEYTHVELSTLSDSGWIAGYATRPLGDPQRNLQSLVMHVETQETILLPVDAGVRDSCAQDISADGSRVSGYAIARDPPRLFPVVWTQTEDVWKFQRLPCPLDYNPLLVSARVMLSDDGRTAVASLATQLDALGLPVYSLFQFQLEANGEWRSSILVPYAVHVADVNDRGQVAGRVLIRGKKRPFFYDPEQGGKELPVPATAEHVYVTDLNSSGAAVGIAEDPRGPEGSSHAVLWVAGQLRKIPFGIPVVASTANGITDDWKVGGLLERELSPDPVPAATASDPSAQQAGPDEFPTEGYLLQLKPERDSN